MSSGENKKGLKITNKNQPNSQKRIDLDEKALEFFDKNEEYKKRAWELALNFKSFIEDKTLKENKGVILENLEKEALDKLINLSLEMNADENQPEGIGSSSLCMLLMKCMLIQRDIINELMFKVSKLENNK